MSIKGPAIKITSPNKAAITELQKIFDREIDSLAHRLSTASKNAVKLTGKEAVWAWYKASGLDTGFQVADAIRTESHFVRNRKASKVIEITGWFDPEALNATSEYFESAVRWNKKHSELCQYDPGIYIFLLRWEKGIIALPEKATATDSGWVNDNFLISSEGALKDFFADYVNKNAAALIEDSFRGRNQRMGAGLLSSNRVGINNLK